MLSNTHFKYNYDYHILKLYDDVEFNEMDQQVVFLVEINTFGSVGIDLYLLEELPNISTIRNNKNIHFHEINICFPSITTISNNVKIVVEEDERHLNVLFEAEEQNWFQPVESADIKNNYFSGKLTLHLFSVFKITGIGNVTHLEKYYSPFYKSALEFKQLKRQGDYKSPLYIAAKDHYLYMRKYRNLIIYKGKSEKFREFANNIEERYKEKQKDEQ